jgi:hypothetical protein
MAKKKTAKKAPKKPAPKKKAPKRGPREDEVQIAARVFGSLTK